MMLPKAPYHRNTHIAYRNTIDMIYLSTAYLGNVQYFSKILAGKVYIEQHEHYQKQSYRNRCSIITANGPLSLVVPVEKEHGIKMPIREVRIDYRQPWQQMHWRALTAAYMSSPFFEYYADDYRPFYEKRYELLFDFNLELTQLSLSLLGLKASLHLTESYVAQPDNSELDYRQSINPKARLAKPDSSFSPQPYTQVFGSRWGFSPNLSIVDLIFNEGPNALQVLKNSIRQLQ